MPWMAVEKTYEFEGPRGKVSLLDLAHLNARNTTLAYASRALQPDIARLKERMGWKLPWYTMATMCSFATITGRCSPRPF